MNITKYWETIFITFIFTLAVTAAAVSAPMKVKIDKIQGKVEMREGGGAWKAAANGASVPLNAEIRTGAGASCMLKWAGGNVVKVSPLSQLKISEADKSTNGKENSTVELSNGKVSAHAKKFNTPDSSFKVKTPTAVAGVRGSDVIGEHDPATGDSSFGVAEGVFAVEAGGEEIILEPGFEIDYNEMTGFSDIMDIPVEELQEIKEEFEEINTEAEQDAATIDETSEEETEEEEAGEEKEEAEESAPDEEAPVEEVSVDEVLDVIQTAIDTDIIETILEEVEDDFVTGDVEVIIELNNQPQ